MSKQQLRYKDLKLVIDDIKSLVEDGEVTASAADRVFQMTDPTERKSGLSRDLNDQLDLIWAYSGIISGLCALVEDGGKIELVARDGERVILEGGEEEEAGDERQT